MSRIQIGYVKSLGSILPIRFWSEDFTYRWRGLENRVFRSTLAIDAYSRKNSKRMRNNEKMMTSLKRLGTGALAVVVTLAPTAFAAQLSSDGKASIPHDVQQVIVVDYRAMQNSTAAMELKDRVLPPELKRLEAAMKSSGLKVDQDADVLAFAAFRDTGGEGTRIVGIAQGQFHTREIMANFTKNKIKPTMIRNNSVYPMGSNGMSVIFLNQTTMVFGDKEAVKERS